VVLDLHLDSIISILRETNDNLTAARRGEGVLRRAGHRFVHHDADGRVGIDALDHGAAVRFIGKVNAARREAVEVVRATAERHEVVPQVRAVARATGA
jgi:hypothetical protein